MLEQPAPLTPAPGRPTWRRGCRPIPPLLQAARTNLAGANARDLWIGGVRAFEEQSEALATLRTRVGGSNEGALGRDRRRAQTATDEFAGWLRGRSAEKDRALGHRQGALHLVPAQRAAGAAVVGRRGGDHASASSRAPTRRCASRRTATGACRRSKSPTRPRPTQALQERAIARYLKWVADQRILTMEPWMERALRERTAPFSPAASRNFFMQATQRDPIPLWTHLYHWWDNMRIRVAPHASPIRRGPLLYNVWMSRAEGMATAMEEWMMHAGLYDESPRSREIVWIMLMNRAARAVGNLFAHANDLTMEQAGDIHVNWTPRGWMRRDPLLGFEQHLYLRQPGYGASYITGGRLMEEVIAERARQLGDAFTLQRVMDEINAAGMIPASLIYWEVTGDDRMMRELAEGRPLPPER